ncbi:DUF4272 domain-containing protein [Vibrio parahaemolyticus]|uniref:DUF4272 domain-containing protein n=1 Tax=Vibrio parahaemolyticus TaxID=670 RepID=UPI000C1CCA89|nr:DUF4272 domain-containing protein [Vibrio parahaemolyticus]EGX7690650.1 DUF4272 domain-containing protein [Vibrio parahaemolyticus]PIS70288.1 hypothetical protein H271_10425 [Vibrio parahaemolyticus 1911C]
MEEIKYKNIQYLKSIGIEVPDHLPQIEGLGEVSPRTAQDIASRLSALAYVIGLGFGAKGQDLLDNLNQFALLPFVSEYEKSLLSQPTVGEQDKVNMSWLAESAQALAWCIGLVELNHFTHCDSDLANKIPFKSDPTEFIKKARLRSIYEIQTQSDLLYRLHWYVRECNLIGQDCLLNQSIVSERRKAIDWAYGVEENWDEVPLDT